MISRIYFVQLLAFNIFFTLMSMEKPQQDGLLVKISDFALNNIPGSCIVRICLALGADPNKKDSMGFPPLHRAIQSEDSAKIKALLENRLVDPNIRDDFGYTPLHEAVSEQHPEIVELLLKNSRVKSDIKNKQEQTPLDLARSRERVILENFTNPFYFSHVTYKKVVEYQYLRAQVISDLMANTHDNFDTNLSIKKKDD